MFKEAALVNLERGSLSTRVCDELFKSFNRAEERERYGNSWLDGWADTASCAAKNEIRKQVSLLTFEEFAERKKQGTAFSLKPVAPSASAEAASSIPPPEDMAAKDESAVTEHEAPAEILDMGPTIQPATNLATEPALPEAALELPPEPPLPEPGRNALGR